MFLQVSCSLVCTNCNHRLFSPKMQLKLFFNHERYAVVPWLLAVATGYSFALRHAAQSTPQKFENIIWTLGIFSTALLIGCALFTWWDSRQTKRIGA